MRREASIHEPHWTLWALLLLGPGAGCAEPVATDPAHPADDRATATDNRLTDAEKADGWILLFDGKTLDGWVTSEGKPSKTPVEDGCLNPHGSGHYMLVRKEQYSDFALSLDFKMCPKRDGVGCNSGIFVRTRSLEPLPGKDVGYNGIEVAIDDTTTAGYTDTGAIYDLAKPSRNAMKPAGEWNHAVVTCSGSRISVELNGEKVTEVDLDRFTEKNRRPDGTAHKFEIAYRDHPRKGYIGLQDHGSPCWFKNIKLRPLAAPAGGAPGGPGGAPAPTGGRSGATNEKP